MDPSRIQTPFPSTPRLNLGNSSDHQSILNFHAKVFIHASLLEALNTKTKRAAYDIHSRPFLSDSAEVYC